MYCSFLTSTRKTLKLMYFPVQYEKPKKNPSYWKKPIKNPRQSEITQEPKIGSKNPRSWEKTQGVATLVTKSIKRRKRTQAPPIDNVGRYYQESIIFTS